MKSTFHERRLPNGLRMVCEVMPRVRSAALGFLVRTGSRHETRPEHGVSHFLEHMCFKGTATRNWHDINVRFDELGSIYNAFTSKEHTVYYGWLPAARSGDQLELLADMMRPALKEEDFQTERNVILEEIAMGDDSFDRNVAEFLHEAIFTPHPLAHEIIGEKETIQGLAHETLVNYHRRRYAAENMVLCGAGALDPDEFFDNAERLCGRWSAGGDGQRSQPPGPLKPGVYRRKLDRFNQQTLVLLYPSVPHGHADEENIEAFTALFGGANSRCYWHIVQKGVCTVAGAAWLAYADFGMVGIYADGQPDRCERMLDAVREEAAAVMRDGFSEQEVRRVKNRRRTQLALEAENPRTRLMQIIDDIETRGRLLDAEARLAAVEAVTPATIAGYLRRYPITGPDTLVSVGPRDWPS